MRYYGALYSIEDKAHATCPIALTLARRYRIALARTGADRRKQKTLKFYKYLHSVTRTEEAAMEITAVPAERSRCEVINLKLDEI